MGNPEYKEIPIRKTVLDPDIHNIEDLTSKVHNEVRRVVTSNDVNRAIEAGKHVPLDITIDDMKIRTYIDFDRTTGGVKIENYHIDSGKMQSK